jgi:Outer membrane efflux protein
VLAPLDFTIDKGQFGTFPRTGPIQGSNIDLHTRARPNAIASVTATQPLTQLIRIHLSIADQRLKVDAAQLSFDQREQKLADDVRRQSYYQVLQSQIQYESQQSMVKSRSLSTPISEAASTTLIFDERQFMTGR